MKDRILKYSLVLLAIITLVLASGCAEDGQNASNDTIIDDSEHVSSNGDDDTVTDDSDMETPEEEEEEDMPEENFIYKNATVEEIEVLILESFPVQIHVVATGYFPDGCTELDKITIIREDNTFNVHITSKRPADAICTQAIVPFEEVIPLDVYGLEAGVYEVDVNGVKGSFELTVDNIPQ